MDGLDALSIRSIAASGQNTMPGFGGVYTGPELSDVAAYITEHLSTVR